jgi:hypothetical protein
LNGEKEKMNLQERLAILRQPQPEPHSESELRKIRLLPSEDDVMSRQSERNLPESDFLEMVQELHDAPDVYDHIILRSVALYDDRCLVSSSMSFQGNVGDSLIGVSEIIGTIIDRSFTPRIDYSEINEFGFVADSPCKEQFPPETIFHKVEELDNQLSYCMNVPGNYDKVCDYGYMINTLNRAQERLNDFHSSLKKEMGEDYEDFLSRWGWAKKINPSDLTQINNYFVSLMSLPPKGSYMDIVPPSKTLQSYNLFHKTQMYAHKVAEEICDTQGVHFEPVIQSACMLISHDENLFRPEAIIADFTFELDLLHVLSEQILTDYGMSGSQIIEYLAKGGTF